MSEKPVQRYIRELVEGLLDEIEEQAEANLPDCYRCDSLDLVAEILRGIRDNWKFMLKKKGVI